MDTLDLNILALYRHDTKISAEKIGSMVGLSISAVQRRIKHLKNSGIIQRELALLDSDKLSFQMQFIINVDLINERVDDIQLFENKMKSNPNVMQSYYVTGQADFCIVIAVKNVTEFDLFTQTILMSDENVRNFTSSLVIRKTKFDPSSYVDLLLD
ncbi:Lrp/AsnC family transcriptional regulator [Vibrio sp. RC27]